MFQKSKIQNPQNPENPKSPKSKIPKIQNPHNPKSKIPKIQNPQNPKSKIPKIQNPQNPKSSAKIQNLGHWGPHVKNCYITIQNPKSPKSGQKSLDFGFWGFWILGSLDFGILGDFGFWGFWILGFWGFWILGILVFGILGILDFGDFGFWILGRSRGCTTRQFGDGAWRSEARIPPGLPLGATSKPTVSNRVGARKQIEHFFRGQNPTKSQKHPDFQPRGQNFTKSQKNPDFQPRGQNPTKSQKKPRLPTQRSELYKITEKPRLQSLSSYTVYTFRFDTCFVHPLVTKTPISKSKSLTTDSCSLRDFCPRNSLNLTLQENKKIQLPFVVWKWEFPRIS